MEGRSHTHVPSSEITKHGGGESRALEIILSKHTASLVIGAPESMLSSK